MQRIPSTRAQGQAPRLRRGGPVTFRGQTYATTAALEQALAGAIQDAGDVYHVRLTRKGQRLADELAAEAGR